MRLYYVYILRCSDETYYTGFTNNMARRMYEHESGINKNCYTYFRRPLELVFVTSFNDPGQAIAFEKRIKKWSKKKKEAIIQNKWEDLRDLSKKKFGKEVKLNHPIK